MAKRRKGDGTAKGFYLNLPWALFKKICRIAHDKGTLRTLSGEMCDQDPRAACRHDTCPMLKRDDVQRSDVAEDVVEDPWRRSDDPVIWTSVGKPNVRMEER